MIAGWCRQEVAICFCSLDFGAVLIIHGTPCVAVIYLAFVTRIPTRASSVGYVGSQDHDCLKPLSVILTTSVHIYVEGTSE